MESPKGEGLNGSSESHTDRHTEESHGALSTPNSRFLGQTEQNWCRAVKSGTGNTVVGLLFGRKIDAKKLQVAVYEVQMKHPRLRSRLVQIRDRLAFEVSESPFTVVQVYSHSNTADDEKRNECDIHLRGKGNGNGNGSMVEKENGFVKDQNGIHGHPQDDCILNENHEVWEDASEDFDEHHHHIDSSVDNKHVKSLCQETLHDKNEIEEEKEKEKEKEKENGMKKKDFESGDDFPEPVNEDWFQIVENELNIPFPVFSDRNDKKQIDLFDIKLFEFGKRKSVVIIRAHTCICDRIAAGEICFHLLYALDQQVNGVMPPAISVDALSPEKQQKSHEANPLLCIEDLVPKAKSHKPFWAHGKDLIGYGLGSRRQACLFFDDYASNRRSEIIRNSLTKQETNILLKLCEEKKTNLYGILSASALLACAMSKKLGNHGEHFSICSLIDCREVLSPPLPLSTVGFYHSALLNAYAVKETSGLWELAKQCSSSLEQSVEKGKHFSDMNDLNMLMAQAIHHPRLTPYRSLRTSLLCLFRGSLQQNMQELGERLQVEDSLGCSSVHGVGPCMAIFDSIQHDGLHMVFVYPSPLFSRSKMQQLADAMRNILKNEIQNVV